MTRQKEKKSRRLSIGAENRRANILISSKRQALDPKRRHPSRAFGLRITMAEKMIADKAKSD
jgi:hypothetical protein